MAQRRGERMKRHLAVVGNPGCRRVAFWKAASARLGWAGFDVFTYPDLVQDRFGSIPSDAVVRIETPGGDWETFKLLLKHGGKLAQSEGYPALDDRAIDRLQYERGWLIRPRQAHLGYLRLLRSLEFHLISSGADTMHTAEEIAVCFDKPACQARLARHGVPIPACLGSPRSYDELKILVHSDRRVMVKLAHGSGAVGCVAIHYANGRARAVTTVAQMQMAGESRLYLSKRPIYLAGELEIAALVDRLCVEGVQAEAWLPKARWHGRNIDLRVVTIDGVPRHVVVRSSTSVFTNLTLGARRDNLSAIVQRMGPHVWQRIRDTCASVAAAFPVSFTLGIDVLIRPDWDRHNVLEVNAFGDLLINELDQGEDTYAATLNAWQRRTRLTLAGQMRQALRAGVTCRHS
jgi:glutathione synthase/RimK-type ligase-like ATP-grasp enzyme